MGGAGHRRALSSLRLFGFLRDRFCRMIHNSLSLLVSRFLSPAARTLRISRLTSSVGFEPGRFAAWVPALRRPCEIWRLERIGRLPERAASLRPGTALPCVLRLWHFC